MRRRAFAESLAVAALAPMLGVPVETIRLDPPVPGAPPEPAMPEGASAGGAGSLALVLTEIIRLRYGSRLHAGALATITGQIEAGLECADLIRDAERGEVVPVRAAPPRRG